MFQTNQSLPMPPAGMSDRALEAEMRQIGVRKLAIRQKLDVMADLVRREMPEHRRMPRTDIYKPLRALNARLDALLIEWRARQAESSRARGRHGA